MTDQPQKTASYKKGALFLILTVLAAMAWTMVGSHHSQATEESLNTGTDKEAMGDFIRDYLVANPEVVIEAIEAYQANQQEIEQKRFQDKLSSSQKLLTAKDTPFAGNPDGDVVVVEFFDYNCGYCHRAADDVVALLESDQNVKIYFKDMPILSENSKEASRWALAADKQDKYYEYHIALMKHKGPKNENSLEKIGKDLGLDVIKLRRDADSKAVREKIEKNLSLSRELGIRGTPAFIIGDTLAPGYMGLENMKKAIAATRGDNG